MLAENNIYERGRECNTKKTCGMGGEIHTTRWRFASHSFQFSIRINFQINGRTLQCIQPRGEWDKMRERERKWRQNLQKIKSRCNNVSAELSWDALSRTQLTLCILVSLSSCLSRERESFECVSQVNNVVSCSSSSQMSFFWVELLSCWSERSEITMTC